MRYVVLALAWTAYGAVHSAMISETATGFLKRRLGDSFRLYRLFFNVVAVVLLVPVAWYSRSLRQEPVVRWDGPWLAVRYAVVAVGVLLFFAGGRHYSLGQFVGSAPRGTQARPGVRRRLARLPAAGVDVRPGEMAPLPEASSWEGKKVRIRGVVRSTGGGPRTCWRGGNRRTC